MIGPRHRLLLGACLLSTGRTALVILISGPPVSTGDPAASGAKPRIFLDHERSVVACQILRLSKGSSITASEATTAPWTEPSAAHGKTRRSFIPGVQNYG